MTTIDNYNKNKGEDVYSKIQKGKMYFMEQGIKKSGRNKFHKFQYYELKDLLPVVLRWMEDNHMSNHYNFSSTEGIMIICDEDTMTSASFSIPLPPVNMENPFQAMQVIGGLQTYARRYLLIQAFDIEELDSIDCIDTKKVPKQRKTQQTAKESKPTTTEIVNMFHEVERSLNNENKELNQINFYSKADELYHDKQGYSDVVAMFDRGMKKAKQTSNYVTY